MQIVSRKPTTHAVKVKKLVSLSTTFSSSSISISFPLVPWLGVLGRRLVAYAVVAL